MVKMTAKNKGFSLVELMIAMAVSIIVLGGIYTIYNSQTKSHRTQQEIVNMQQNLRAAMALMEKEIMMAGSDPSEKAGAEIVTATGSTLRFTMDITGGENDGIDNDQDGDADPTDQDEFYDGETDDGNEDITYALTNDANGDGIADGSPCDLGRNTGGGLQTIAENIDALNFVYLDEDGAVLATPVISREDIRAIQITLVARSGETLPVVFNRETQNRIFLNQQNDVVLNQPSDGFHRILLTTEVKGRNMS